MFYALTFRWLRFSVLCAVAVLPWHNATASETVACNEGASSDCYFSFRPSGAEGNLHYYASRSPAIKESGFAPASALIAVHGHSRDANKSFNAALLAVKQAGANNQVLVVAPLYQINIAEAGKCQTAGVPVAQAGDLLWTCNSWFSGGAATHATGQSISSFAAMDALFIELKQHWPSLKTITLSGFSAGAQMVQRYISFAALPPQGVALRFVVAAPGTWLYFDPVRPQLLRAGTAADWTQCSGGTNNLGDCTLDFKPVEDSVCPGSNRWKYGMQDMPRQLLSGTDLPALRSRYAQADVSYLEGAGDTGEARGTAYNILDKSCAAQAQGPYRLQRGLAYAEYDRQTLAPAKKREVIVVPGCAHDVACVFPSAAARATLLGSGY